MQFPINVSPAAKYLLDSCTLHLHLHLLLLLLLLPVLRVVCVCGMRRVQQVNYRCAQLALGCAINLAGCSIRTSTQFNECANIGYLTVPVRDCVGVRARLCVCVCVRWWACKSFAGKGWATI